MAIMEVSVQLRSGPPSVREVMSHKKGLIPEDGPYDIFILQTICSKHLLNLDIYIHLYMEGFVEQ